MNAGGNFLSTLTIDDKGNLTEAAGPLIANPGDELELYVWVATQDAVYKSEVKGTAGFKNVGGTDASWSTLGATPEQTGTFRAGTGTGLAVVIAKTGKQVSVSWWAASLTLEELPQGAASA